MKLLSYRLTVLCNSYSIVVYNKVLKRLSTVFRLAMDLNLARLPYLCDEDTPGKLLEECRLSLKNWKQDRDSLRLTKDSHHSDIVTIRKRMNSMKSYEKERTMNLIWQSNKLESTMPPGLTKCETYKILDELYDSSDSSTATSASDLFKDNTQLENTENRLSRRQLVQHLLAYKEVTRWSQSGKPLTEDVIKEVHRILMSNLKTEDDEPVGAGNYRTISVHADDHVFPSYDCIPKNMTDIVMNYNQKSSLDHDPYQLASWLLFQVISLHPFLDGNGRTCRLLWCASLMKDGLPFPLTLTSGHKKAHRHYVQCIEKDRRSRTADQPNLTTLTILSVRNSWNNFWFNQKYEQ